MRRLGFRLPSPALVVAGIALVVALGGTGYAALALPSNSVGTPQLKPDAVTSGKVKNGSLVRADFKPGQLLRGAKGAKGAVGAKGPVGATGAAGAPGPAGAVGAAGPFPSVLPAGLTLRGAFNLGGTAAALGDLANTSISFVFTLASVPTVIVVPPGTVPPANCPGTVAVPQAKPGFLCLFEDEVTNLDTAGLQVNGAERSGGTIYVNAAAPGVFFSFGTWAVTSS